MRLYLKDFTPSEKKIYDFVTNNPGEILRCNIYTVSKEVPVSKSVFLRFCQKCGWLGFSEFKYDITRYLLAVNEKDADEGIDTFLKNYIDRINNLSKLISTNTLDHTAELIKNARKIKIFGIHETGLSVEYFDYRLSSIGYDCEPIIDQTFFDQKISMCNKEDLNIFITLSAMSETANTINTSVENNIPTLLITENERSEYKDIVNETINIGSFLTDKKKSFLDSQSIVFIVIDIIVNYLSKK